MNGMDQLATSESRAGVWRGFTHHFLPLCLSAVIFGLCFPRPGWSWLVWISLVPAGVVAVRSFSSWRLVWTSYLVSLLWWMVMLSWLYPVTGGGYIGLGAYMAIYFSLALFGARCLSKFWRLPMTLALPLAWVSFEWIRGQWLQGGFAWFNLAHPLAPWQPTDRAGWVIQFADVFGDVGVSFVVAMTNGFLVDLLTMRFRGMRGPIDTGRPRANRKLVFAGCVWLIGMTLTLAHGWYQISRADAHLSPGPSVLVIQTNVPHDNKISTDASQVDRDWQALLSQTLEAVSEADSPQVVVWPETVVPAPMNRQAVNYFRDVAAMYDKLTGEDLAASDNAALHETIAGNLGVTLDELPAIEAARYRKYANYSQQISDLASSSGAMIFVGAGSEYFDGSRLRYNSVYLFHPDGKRDVMRHDKMHRVPFGEYIPWVNNWPWLKRMFVTYISPYDFDYTLQPGAAARVFATDRWRFATPICYEDVLAWVVLAMMQSGDGQKSADAIINLTNDAWYSGHQRIQHFQIAVFRSIEHRVPTARSVNTGVSGFIDSLGRVGPMVQVDGKHQHVAGSVSHQLMLDSRVTWFALWGHWPVGLMTGVVLLMVLIAMFSRHIFKSGTSENLPGA